ncbi:MAG: phosphate ABC transporter permease subunit PstC [Candidatus Thorarchaeota archaeon]
MQFDTEIKKSTLRSLITPRMINYVTYLIILISLMSCFFTYLTALPAVERADKKGYLVVNQIIYLNPIVFSLVMIGIFVTYLIFVYICQSFRQILYTISFGFSYAVILFLISTTINNGYVKRGTIQESYISSEVVSEIIIYLIITLFIFIFVFIFSSEKRENEQIIQGTLVFSAFFSIIAISLILFFLLNDAYVGFVKIGLEEFLFSTRWRPTSTLNPEYGSVTLLVGTFAVTVGALVVAVPLGIGSAIFISEIAPEEWRMIIKPIVELLAGIPSVIYGFFGLSVLTVALQDIFFLPSGSSWLAGSIILGIMALPTITSVAEDAINAVPREFKEGSLALGATNWHTIQKVTIPAALSGITAAVILGMGRAIGETMAVLMVTGNSQKIPEPLYNFFESVRTITGSIGIEMGEVAFYSDHYHALFGLGFMLLVIALIINLSSIYIMGKLRAGFKTTTVVQEKRSHLSPLVFVFSGFSLLLSLYLFSLSFSSLSLPFSFLPISLPFHPFTRPLPPVNLPPLALFNLSVFFFFICILLLSSSSYIPENIRKYLVYAFRLSVLVYAQYMVWYYYSFVGASFFVLFAGILIGYKYITSRTILNLASLGIGLFAYIFVFEIESLFLFILGFSIFASLKYIFGRLEPKSIQKIAYGCVFGTIVTVMLTLGIILVDIIVKGLGALSIEFAPSTEESGAAAAGLGLLEFVLILFYIGFCMVLLYYALTKKLTDGRKILLALIGGIIFPPILFISIILYNFYDVFITPVLNGFGLYVFGWWISFGSGVFTFVFYFLGVGVIIYYYHFNKKIADWPLKNAFIEGLVFPPIVFGVLVLYNNFIKQLIMWFRLLEFTFISFLIGFFLIILFFIVNKNLTDWPKIKTALSAGFLLPSLLFFGIILYDNLLKSFGRPIVEEYAFLQNIPFLTQLITEPFIDIPFLTDRVREGGLAGGIYPAIVGTFYLIVGAILIALPIGMAAAIYLHEYKTEGRITRVVRAGFDLLNGTPSIVYGLFGMAFLVLFLAWGRCMLAGQITLGLMILPTILRTTEESLKSVPDSLREGSMALGATKWKTIRKIVLPYSLPGIITGAILSIGRAAGETAPIMFTAVVLYQRYLPDSLFKPVQALPFHLFYLATAVPQSYLNRYGSALVLMVLVCSLYLIAILLRNHYTKKVKW